MINELQLLKIGLCIWIWLVIILFLFPNVEQGESFVIDISYLL
jgi:hypothetical protein